MSVCCECCVLLVEVSAADRSLVQRSPTECAVSVIDEPNRGDLDPTRAVVP